MERDQQLRGVGLTRDSTLVDPHFSPHGDVWLGDSPCCSVHVRTVYGMKA